MVDIMRCDVLYCTVGLTITLIPVNDEVFVVVFLLKATTIGNVSLSIHFILKVMNNELCPHFVRSSVRR